MPQVFSNDARSPGRTVVSFATPLAISAANGLRQDITLTGALTISSIGGLQDGQTLILWLVQDGTGGRLVTWPTIRWATGAAPTLTAAANKIDAISITRRGSELIGMVVGSNI